MSGVVSLPHHDSFFSSSGNKDEDQVQEVLKKAVKELEYGRMPGNFQKLVVNGDDLDAAFSELLAAMKELYKHLS